MSLTPYLIAKLCHTELGLATRAFNYVGSLDSPGGQPPEELRGGAGARCYALALIARYRPLHFRVGLFGVIAFPAYFVGRYGPGLLASIWQHAMLLAGFGGGIHGG